MANSPFLRVWRKNMKKVVTFGELMLRLAPEGYLRFVQSEKFEATFGTLTNLTCENGRVAFIGEAMTEHEAAKKAEAASSALVARIRVLA